jgi:hypothetical protein
MNIIIMKSTTDIADAYPMLEFDENALEYI